ncbi:MAG TPA: hypothetical protein VIH24_01425 [Candidatus Limnocylindria bacterium]
MTATESSTPAEGTRPVPWRGIAAWVVVVLTCLAVTASVVGLWAHRTVLETDAFMAAVTPAVESEAVQALVSERLSDQLIEALDLESRIAGALQTAEERLVEALAEALDLSEAIVGRLLDRGLGLEDLASTLSSGVEARIREVVGNLVSSPEGTQLLLRVAEVTHERTVHLLRDELDQLPNVVVEDGEVRLNLVPLMAEVLRGVFNAGIDVIGIDREIPAFDSSEDAEAAIARLAGVLGRDLPPDFGQVQIMSEERLENAQNLLTLFDRATWLIVGVTVLLALLAIGLAPSVPKGLVRVGGAALVGAGVGWFAVNLILAGIADGAATAAGRAAIGDIAGSIVNTMLGTAILLAVIGITAGLIGIFLGRRSSTDEVAV